jgi:hypothetical protein
MEYKNYHDLDDKIKIIYDYLYNIHTTTCYSFNNISLGKIGMEDIKIPIIIKNNEALTEKPSAGINESYYHFYETNKTTILDGRFKLIEFDEKNYQIILKKYSNQFSINIKINFYSKVEDINTMNSKINNESLFSYLLSQIVLAKKTKHILIPIMNIDTTLSNIETIINGYNIVPMLKTAILNTNITDTCCLQIREHFFKTTNLEEYLSNNVCSYKVLLFQVIHTLAIIQTEYDGFRHNNLILKNIIVYIKKNSTSYLEYSGFKNDKFFIPNLDFDIKISNFDYSVIPKYYGLFNLTDTTIKFADKPNPYYDLFTFLNDLIEGTSLMSLYSDKNVCDNETKSFFDRVIPKHIRGLDNKNFNKNYVIVSPIDLLYDKYFDEFKTNPTITPSALINTSLTNLNINTFIDSDNISTLGNQNKLISRTDIMKIYNPNEQNINIRIIKKDDNYNKIIRVNKDEIIKTKIKKRIKKLHGGNNDSDNDSSGNMSNNNDHNNNNNNNNDNNDNNDNNGFQHFDYTQNAGNSYDEASTLQGYAHSNVNNNSFSPQGYTSNYDDNNYGGSNNNNNNYDSSNNNNYGSSNNNNNNYGSSNNNTYGGSNNNNGGSNNTYGGSNNNNNKYGNASNNYGNASNNYGDASNGKLPNGGHNKLYGGSEKPDSTPYKPIRNNPFISNDQKNINKKRNDENPKKEQPKILEQTIYDTSQKPQGKPTFPPTFIPLYDQQGTFANHMLPYSNVINQAPSQKVYNVSISNPLSNHRALNRIYEDILPGGEQNYTASTLYERSQLTDYLRNTILELKDGEEVHTSNGVNSLLSYIKMMDINPYTINKNPYQDLPNNFLLYRAGYPIRLDSKVNSITLGKPSMGMNVRLYMMTLGDIKCTTINSNIDGENFDLWREIRYYNWVRDTCVRGKVSPNFISPFLYKIDSQSKINWAQINMYKRGNISKDVINIKNKKTLNNLHDLDKRMGYFQMLLPPRSNLQLKNKKYIKEDDKKVIKDTIKEAIKTGDDEAAKIAIIEATKEAIKEASKEDLTISCGKTLILLTEAPTSSIIQWATVIYESFGSVKKMISTGYHSPDVWKSIIFQLVYAFAVLQESDIYISEFSLENNVYIKDLFSDGNAIGSWIYIVDNIKYYIPNYGYLLVLDTKYTDIKVLLPLESYTKSPTLLSLDTPSIETTKQEYKINGALYAKNNIKSQEDRINRIYDQFRDIINPDNFSHIFKVKGRSPPDETILTLLKQLYEYGPTKIIKDIIKENFYIFLHNRAGTLLYNSEFEKVNKISRPTFKKGELLVYQKKYSEYIWVIYNGPDASSGKHNIIYKDLINNTYETHTVFLSSLWHYPENENLLLVNIGNMRYDSKYIYETYNLNNITKK